MFTIEKIKENLNKVLKRVESVQYSTEMMRNLMLDLLDLAQMENKNFKINEEFFNLYEIIESSFEVTRHSADRRQVKLVSPVLPEREHALFKQISGDSRRYMQIMINCLSNALKFSNNDSEICINIRLNEIIAKKEIKPVEKPQPQQEQRKDSWASIHLNPIKAIG